MNITEGEITINKETLEEYIIAQQQCEVLSIIWKECAEEIEKITEEKAIYRNFSEIFEYLAGNYSELIETIKWYNEYKTKEKEERTYQWTNRETMEK